MAPFRPQALKTVLTHVAVGMGAASFWRGAWYVLDDHLFPESPEQSAAASLGLGTLGMAASQGLVARIEAFGKQVAPHPRAVPLSLLRFGALYSIAFSCVLVWRGTWLGWDVLYERLHEPVQVTTTSLLAKEPREQSEMQTEVNATDPGHATKSGVLSHSVAIGLLLGTGLFASVLAPPAAVSVIRDLTVKAGGKPYSGPAQALTQRLFRPKMAAVTRTIHTSKRFSQR